jgi:hypothetical protein
MSCWRCERFVLIGEAHEEVRPFVDHPDSVWRQHIACPKRPPVQCPNCQRTAHYGTVMGRYRCGGCDTHYSETDIAEDRRRLVARIAELEAQNRSLRAGAAA